MPSPVESNLGQEHYKNVSTDDESDKLLPHVKKSAHNLDEVAVTGNSYIKIDYLRLWSLLAVIDHL